MDVYQAALSKWGLDLQLRQLAEECCELSVEALPSPQKYLLQTSCRYYHTASRIVHKYSYYSSNIPHYEEQS